MGGTDPKTGTPTNGKWKVSWFWATVLSVQPILTTAALVGILLFVLVSTATVSLQLPGYLPLVPGTLMLIFVGVAYVYTPVFLVGLVLDLRKVRNTEAVWSPSWWFLLGGSVQIAYFSIPIIQAYEVQTFEELVFGAVEFTALIVTGVTTVRYLRARDNNFSGAPTLVSLWSGLWAHTIHRFD